MRVYSREVEQGLVIGSDVRVTVLEIGEDFVRLGIEHGEDEPGYREEIVRFDSAEVDGLAAAVLN